MATTPWRTDRAGKKSPRGENYVAGADVDAFAAARNTFNCLVGQLTDSKTLSLGHDRLEDLLLERGRELQRLLLQAHLDLRAMRERQAAEHLRGTGAGIIGPDGVQRRRLEAGHHRPLATVFGTVTVTRCAWRAAGTGYLHPADEALSLPAGRHSHGLGRLAALEAVRGSFDNALEAIGARCGKGGGQTATSGAGAAGGGRYRHLQRLGHADAAHRRRTTGPQHRRQRGREKGS
ncbi:hypothetical protein [Spirillospora sp. NPDC047279]|uniref:hypothetical protein n=1 Tax=Spirillospora sp. NPDC047279 TaxID=3155478 RepID=UPI00340A7B3B